MQDIKPVNIKLTQEMINANEQIVLLCRCGNTLGAFAQDIRNKPVCLLECPICDFVTYLKEID
jgi:hypothetical protein